MIKNPLILMVHESDVLEYSEEQLLNLLLDNSNFYVINSNVNYEGEALFFEGLEYLQKHCKNFYKKYALLIERKNEKNDKESK